ncbi:MAG: AAA family ATPase [Candidatus Thorarchaeota archaeon]|nr:AAA family ATPase [Candidatus Thorarchaeota archaeon]
MTDEIRIRSVSIKNFLSFYEGKIELDPGLNVVVGPNGAGKTSIFHAMKFALGSNQREKRYSKWSDFIRHGARTAQVKITIDAENGLRTLTRKISRGRVPRAYIDGKRVKASELRMLVDSYDVDVDSNLVFMPQERINALRNMNPVEVRKLIEEGTGLDRLRQKIEAEVTRLGATKEKLETAISESETVRNELHLLSYDLERLEKKRELLKKKNQLQEELNWAKIEHLEEEMAAVEKDLQEKNASLSKVVEKSEHMKEKKDGLDEKVSALTEQTNDMKMEMARLDARIEQEEERIEAAHEENQSNLEEIQELRNRIKKSDSRAHTLEQQLENQILVLESYESREEELQQSLEEIESEQDGIEEKLAEYAEWNAKRARVHGEYKTLKTELKGKDVLSRSLMERLQVEKADLDSIEKKWEDVWAKLEDTDEEGLRKEKQSLEARISKLKEQLFEARSRSATIQKEITSIEAKLAEFSARVPASIRKFKTSVDKHGLERVFGPIIEILRPEEEFSPILDSVLRGDMPFAFIVEEQSDYQLLQKIREQSNAPAPLIYIGNTKNEIRSSPHESDQVLGELWELLGLSDEMLNRFRTAFGCYAVTHEGGSALEVASQQHIGAVSQDGSVFDVETDAVISYPRKENRGLLSTAPLKDRIELLRESLQEKETRILELEQKLEELQYERDQIAEFVEQVHMWGNTWEKRNKLRENIRNLEERIALVEEDKTEIQGELKKSEKKLKDLELNQPPGRSNLMGERSALRSKRRRIRKEINDIRARLKQAEHKTEGLRKELEEVEHDRKVYSESMKQLKEKIAESEKETTDLLEKVEAMRERRNELEQKHKTAMGALEETREEQQEVGERLVELNLRIRDSRLETMQNKRQLENMRDEFNTAKKQLTESERPDTVREYEIVTEELVKTRHQLDDYDDVSEAVAHTESKLKKRLDTLESRVHETKTELKEAQDTVGDIQAQYEKGMENVLREIETKIHQILSTVSFAGQVRFSLEDGEEYGVSFQTRIREGDFRSLSSGSGGERSLIALALILALQDLNPGPIYALDEVDTFLDATNTEMISELLYDSSRRSQFILFTPAKTTYLLKHADKRIGVVSPKGTEPSVIIEGPEFLKSEDAKVA